MCFHRRQMVAEARRVASKLASDARLKINEFNHRIAMSKNEQEKIEDARMYSWTTRTKYKEVRKVRNSSAANMVH